MNDHDLDLPLLTDIIEPAPVARTGNGARRPALDSHQEALAERLAASLAAQVPRLVEGALREQLADVLGAKLQAALHTALSHALPAAVQAATAELSASVAYQVGCLLKQQLHNDVRAAVASETIASASHD